jgi:cob(I)alamin adenosyltransferase
MLEKLLQLLEQVEERLYSLGADYHSPHEDDNTTIEEIKKMREILYAISNKASNLLQEEVVTTATIYSYAQDLLNYISSTFGDNIGDNIGDK